MKIKDIKKITSLLRENLDLIDRFKTISVNMEEERIYVINLVDGFMDILYNEYKLKFYAEKYNTFKLTLIGIRNEVRDTKNQEIISKYRKYIEKQFLDMKETFKRLI